MNSYLYKLQNVFAQKFFSGLLALFLVCCGSMYANPITPSLLELLEVTGVQHDGSLSSIVDATQKAWIRPAGKERWQIGHLPHEQNAEIVRIASDMGFLKEIVPTQDSYDYGIVFGATVRPMQLRVDYMIQLWKEGIRFNNIVILCSERPLDPAVEPIYDLCATEADAARYIWVNSDIPDELRALPTQFVSVPMLAEGGKVRRASTLDTIEAWLKTNPKSGSSLFISNQPYCLYQNSVVAPAIPSSFTYETVGAPGKAEFQNGLVLLDTIARWLYNEQKNSMPRSKP